MNIAIIPARSGSVGVKDKNIKNLNGIPLFIHSINHAKCCKKINDIFLTTNSDKYINIAKELGYNTIKRPNYLATNYSSDYDYLIHAIHVLGLNELDDIILLRPTTPFRESKIIDKIIDFFNNNNGSSLRTIQKINESPYKNFSINHYNYLEPYIPNTNLDETNSYRQKFSDCYVGNGYCDIIPVSTIIKTRSVYGKNILAYETDPTIEIDSEFDFKLAELYAKSLNEGC